MSDYEFQLRWIFEFIHNHHADWVEIDDPEISSKLDLSKSTDFEAAVALASDLEMYWIRVLAGDIEPAELMYGLFIVTGNSPEELIADIAYPQSRALEIKEFEDAFKQEFGD